MLAGTLLFPGAIAGLLLAFQAEADLPQPSAASGRSSAVVRNAEHYGMRHHKQPV